MDPIVIDHTTAVRPSEDDVYNSLRRIDPWGGEVVVVIPEPVLARILPRYQKARETLGLPRRARRVAMRAWGNAVRATILAIRSQEIVW